MSGRRRAGVLGAVQGGDPPAVGARIRSCPGCGSGSCWSRWGARRARRSSMTICARSGRCSRRRPGRFSGRSIGRARSASSMSGSRASRGPGRSRPDAPGLGRGRVPGLLARGRGGAGVLQADRGSAGRDRGLPDAAGGVAEGVGLGSPGRHPRPRRAPDGRVRGVLRPAAGRRGGSASRPIRRPRARSSGCRATRRRTSSPAAVRQRARLPGPARRLVSRRSTRARTRRCAPARSTGCVEERERDARAARRDARHRPALGDPGRRRTPICASTPTTTRSIPRWSAGASRSASTSSTCSAVVAGHRRGRLPPRAGVRPAPDDHRARARPRLRDGRPPVRAAVVEVRPLARYDALIA